MKGVLPESSRARPQYANWVPSRLVYVPAATAASLGGLAVLFPWLTIPGVLALACCAYFAYARWQFSPGGGGVQSRIEDLVLDELRWDGKGEALDIGCGNGPLAIAIAKAHPAAHVTGIDTWGAGWEYSRTVCERNAAIEGVSSRTSFQKASAAALPFDDAAFDVVVSNLVFHEVRAVKDKKLLLEEALRVLRPGGVFVFQDLFQWKRVYGDVEVLRAALEAWGVRSVSFRATNDSSFIPTPLKLPFMVGTIGILSGVK